jgi:Ni2+-binding GTPase involved in maturation of urease and hydrogenase
VARQLAKVQRISAARPELDLRADFVRSSLPTGRAMIPRHGDPCITKFNVPLINKANQAAMVGGSLEVMDRDAKRMRGERLFIFANMKSGQGPVEIVAFIERRRSLLVS